MLAEEDWGHKCQKMVSKSKGIWSRKKTQLPHQQALQSTAWVIVTFSRPSQDLQKQFCLIILCLLILKIINSAECWLSEANSKLNLEIPWKKYPVPITHTHTHPYMYAYHTYIYKYCCSHYARFLISWPLCILRNEVTPSQLWRKPRGYLTHDNISKQKKRGVTLRFQRTYKVISVGKQKMNDREFSYHLNCLEHCFDTLKIFMVWVVQNQSLYQGQLLQAESVCATENWRHMVLEYREHLCFLGPHLPYQRCVYLLQRTD